MVISPAPEPTGLFEAQDLSRFDQRQAWFATFDAVTVPSEFQVGERQYVSFDADRARNSKWIGRASAELDLIKNAVHGVVTNNYLGRYNQAATEIQIAQKYVAAVPYTEQVVDTLALAEEQFEQVIEAEKRRKLSDAAGYIATRNNLWIVTDAAYKDTEPKPSITVRFGRLIGLSVDEETFPVVAGKNDRPALLRPKTPSAQDRRTGRYQPLTVLESYRG